MTQHEHLWHTYWTLKGYLDMCAAREINVNFRKMILLSRIIAELHKDLGAELAYAS